MTAPCADVLSTSMYQDMATIFTPIDCAPFGEQDSQYCCFLNHAPGTPTVATLAGWTPSDLVPIPKAAFTLPSTTCGLKDVNNCYNGQRCLAEPDLQGGLGNVTPVVTSDPTCVSPGLSQLSTSTTCPSGWTIGAGCDPTSVHGCVPCCPGLVPVQVGCKAVRGTSYALYQCRAGPACTYPFRKAGDDCYFNDPNTSTCGDSVSKPNPSDPATFVDQCGDGGAFTSWCYNQASKIPQGVFYCQGNADYVKWNPDTCNTNVSTSGQWVKCTDPNGCAVTNAWLNAFESSDDRVSCYCTFPGESPHCIWAQTPPSATLGGLRRVDSPWF